LDAYLWYIFRLSATPYKPPDTQAGKADYANVFTHFLAFLVGAICRNGLTNNLTILPTIIDPISDFDKKITVTPSAAIATLQELMQAVITTKPSNQPSKPHVITAFVILSSLTVNRVICLPNRIAPLLSRVTFFIRASVLQTMICDQRAQDVSDLNLNDIALKYDWLVKEQQNTIFSWVRQMTHLTGSYASSASVLGEFLWLDRSPEVAWLYLTDKITMNSFKAMMQGLVQELNAKMDEICACLGVNREEMMMPEVIVDDLADLTVHYSFMSDKMNHPCRERADELLKKVLEGGQFLRNDGVWLVGNIRKFLNLTRGFVILLLTAISGWGGGPARAVEVCNFALRNRIGRFRNTFWIDNIFTIVSFYNKTTSVQRFDKAIPRAYNKTISTCAFQYLTYVRDAIEPFFLSQALGISPENIERSKDFISFVNNSQLDTSHISACIRRLAKTYLNVNRDWGIAHLRQNLCYIGDRFLNNKDKGEIHQSIVQLQAGHSTSVAERYYGVDSDRLAHQVQESMVRAFMQASRDHWNLFGLGEPEDEVIFVGRLYFWL
jgi:hypothetical protein